MVPVHDYEKRYAEAFVITKIRTFKHEPFFIVGGGGGGGGGAYSWYFTVLARTFQIAQVIFDAPSCECLIYSRKEHEIGPAQFEMYTCMYA